MARTVDKSEDYLKIGGFSGNDNPGRLSKA